MTNKLSYFICLAENRYNNNLTITRESKVEEVKIRFSNSRNLRQVIIDLKDREFIVPANKGKKIPQKGYANTWRHFLLALLSLERFFIITPT